MDHQLETRTKTAQLAVEKAREIVLQNERMAEKLHAKFGLSKYKEEQQDNWQESGEADFKINTNSKMKNYFQDIINSIH